MEYENINRLYNCAYNSIFTINGKLNYDRVTDIIIRLCEVLSNTDTDETVWYIGEYDESGLDGLIIGAYWHYSEWHGGMSSKGYQALCALGQIYEPNMADGPEPESRERDVYEMLHTMVDLYYAKHENNK